ncbi:MULTISPECIES: hypothetical protein [unclassified Sphingobacterium]|uniref:hypothetical protein n=1 Tax=unclassified Sphingobacterium TaxID=2609468 RepID=UPI001052B340|nr:MULTISPECIES: hypothetical protein [unclassified Sphingobacterium]MCS3556783.1 hypothetical protein [Sphingobacterium sp. JUb21]TCQ99289.1 hypothetical protein EDF66_115102 [Sphingobacterium sp. JUb20]
MKYLLLLLLLLFVFSCSPNADKKECRIVYRIGYNFIKLSLNEDGNTTAIIGESNDLENDRFRVDTIIDSARFFLKTSGDFFKKLQSINVKKVEEGKGYSRMQIFLNDSLYYDTRTYSPEFWKLYSIISDDIPNEYNPFKTKRFE